MLNKETKKKKGSNDNWKCFQEQNLIHHFRNEKKNRGRVTFGKDFWDHYLGRAGQLLANYYVFPVPSNSPRSLCKS